MTIGIETNAIYRDVVDQAIALEIDLLRTGGRLEDRRLEKAFGSPAAIARELRRLQQLNLDSRHYELGPYHNALLHAVVTGFIESLNDGLDHRRLVFCGGRFHVGSLDVDAFVDSFFRDLDFTWSADLVNELTEGGKQMLGVDAGVFGVVNELAPAAKELRGVEGDAADAVQPIFEMTAAVEADLRRQVDHDPDGVRRRVGQMGLLYRRARAFPYWPEWLEP